MDQTRIVLATGQRNIADGERVGFIGGGRFPLRQVHLVICPSVEDSPGVALREGVLYQFAVGNIESGPREFPDFIAPARQLGTKFHAQLPRGAKYYYVFCHINRGRCEIPTRSARLRPGTEECPPRRSTKDRRNRKPEEALAQSRAAIPRVACFAPAVALRAGPRSPSIARARRGRQSRSSPSSRCWWFQSAFAAALPALPAQIGKRCVRHRPRSSRRMSSRSRKPCGECARRIPGSASPLHRIRTGIEGRSCGFFLIGRGAARRRLTRQSMMVRLEVRQRHLNETERGFGKRLVFTIDQTQLANHRFRRQRYGAQSSGLHLFFESSA